MAGGEEDTTERLVLPDHGRRGGGGEDPVVTDNELCNAVGRADLEDSLNCLWGPETTITTDDEGLTLGVDRVEDGLHKVLGVVLAITYRIRQ